MQRFRSFQEICPHPWHLKNVRHEVRWHKLAPLVQLFIPQDRYQCIHPTPSPSKTSIKWSSTRPRSSFNVIYRKRFQSEETLVLPWCCKNSQMELPWVLCNNHWTWWSLVSLIMMMRLKQTIWRNLLENGLSSAMT